MTGENVQSHFYRTVQDAILEVLRTPEDNSKVTRPMDIGPIRRFALPDDCAACHGLQNLWKRKEPRLNLWNSSRLTVEAGSSLLRTEPKILEAPL